MAKINQEKGIETDEKESIELQQDTGVMKESQLCQSNLKTQNSTITSSSFKSQDDLKPAAQYCDDEFSASNFPNSTALAQNQGSSYCLNQPISLGRPQFGYNNGFPATQFDQSFNSSRSNNDAYNEQNTNRGHSNRHPTAQFGQGFNSLGNDRMFSNRGYDNPQIGNPSKRFCPDFDSFRNNEMNNQQNTNRGYDNRQNNFSRNNDRITHSF